MTTANAGVVKFGGITKEAAEKARKKVKSGSRSFYEWKDGINTIRMLPPPPGKTEAWVIASQHFFKNWDGGKKNFTFNCPKEMGQGRCPACDRYEALMATGNPTDKEKAKDFKAKSRVFANVIDRKDEESGVQVAAFGSMILEQLCEFIEDDDIYGADFTHPFEGDDLVVKRWDEAGFTKYRANIRNGNHDRLAESEEQMVKWIESAPNLDQYLAVQTYEQLVQKAAELTAEARGEPKPEAPKSDAIDTTARTSKKKKAIAAAEDSDDDEGSEFGGNVGGGGMTNAAASDEGQKATTPF